MEDEIDAGQKKSAPACCDFSRNFFEQMKKIVIRACKMVRNVV